MFYEKDLINAKNSVEQHIGSKVRVRHNSGKKRQKAKDGILLSAYKSVFLINIQVDDNIYTSTSYTYKDLLTENITITVI